MGRVARTTLNPATKNLDLFRGEPLVLLRRRHRIIGVVDSLPEFASLEVTWHDRRHAGIELARCAVEVEKTQTGFTGLFIGTMTSEAMLRKDWPYVTYKIDRRSKKE